MAKQKTKSKAAKDAEPPTTPNKDVTDSFDRMREEYVSLREVADKAEEAAQAKFDEVVAFAQANGITDDPVNEGETGED